VRPTVSYTRLGLVLDQARDATFEGRRGSVTNTGCNHVALVANRRYLKPHVYRRVSEVGRVVPGVNSQGATLDEARENLREALAMVLEANRELARRK